MSIPNQLPQLVAAARSGALQALALQAGQTLEGKVIGPAPSGGTQVQIAGQMLNLVLPTLAKAGETLKFEVQGSGAQVKLALQPAVQQSAPTTMPAASPAPVPARPNTLPLPASQPATSTPSPQAATLPPPAAPAISPQTPQPAVTPPPQSMMPQAGPPAAQQALPSGQAPVGPSSSSLPGQPAASPPPSTVPVIGQSALPPSQSAPPGITPQLSPTGVAPVASMPQSTTPVPPSAPQPQPQQPYPAASPRPAANVLAGAPNAASANAARSAAGGLMPTPQASVAQTPTAPVPATPQAALAQMVQTALPRQNSVTGVMQALSGIAGKVALPEPVVRAAQQVLAGRVALDGDTFDAATLQKAVMRSGVFQEAGLAKPGVPMTPPQADMKASLLALRQTLTTWLGPQAPLTQVAQIPPPVRGHVPRARLSDAPPLDPRAAPEEVGRQLLERTEAALSRVRLHQSASLPDPITKTADWSMDLPVLVGQQQTLLQIQIHRDEQNGGEAAAERGWQMRFAISLPGMGEVGAQVSLRAGNMGVMLWAAKRATSEELEADVASLREALASVGLRPGAVIVRHGEPAAPPPAPSGHFVDSSS